MNALRRYRAFLLLLVAGTVVVAFFFNTWANPWRVTPSPWTSEKLENYRAIENDWNRTAKAGLVRSGTWDAAIFGSSRVDIALNPEHPLFDGYRCVNLGLNAANIVENHAMFRYFVENQDAKLVVFALDPGDLSSPPFRQNRTDFSLSPLDDSAPLERELRYRFGISALRSSAETLGRGARHEPADHSPQGFRFEAPFPEHQRAIIANLYTATIIRLARSRAELDGLSPEKLSLLEDLVATCRKEDIRLILLITPNHALFQLAFVELENPDPYFLRDRRAIVETAGEFAIWDFLGSHPISREALPPPDQPADHMSHWPDLFHVTSEVGDLMLDRINGVAGDFGVPLTPSTIGQRVDSIQVGLAEYASERSEDAEFLRESLLRFAETADP